MQVLKFFFFFLRSVYLSMFGKKVKISLLSRVTIGSVIEGFNKIGKHTYFHGRLGRYSYIGENCKIIAEVGRFCSISPNVKIISGSHPTHFVSTSPVFYSVNKQCGISFVSESKFEEIIYYNKSDRTSCKIGNDVWIGESVLIRGGTIIGDGVVVAMGSVVVSDLKPYKIYGGVPAKEIGSRFSDEIIDKILFTRWWDKSPTWIENNAYLMTDINLLLKKMEDEA